MTNKYGGLIRRNGGSRREVDNGWHLDKKVPISLILAIMVQTGMAVWWLAALESRVSVIENFATERAAVPSRLSTIEANQTWLMRSVERIETAVTVMSRRANLTQE